VLALHTTAPQVPFHISHVVSVGVGGVCTQNAYLQGTRCIAHKRGEFRAKRYGKAIRRNKQHKNNRGKNTYIEEIKEERGEWYSPLSLSLFPLFNSPLPLSPSLSSSLFLSNPLL